MKLDIIDDIYVYFTNDIKCLEDGENVAEDKVAFFLKRVFLDMSEVYGIDLFGYYRVDVYIDKKIGAYVEITKIDDYMGYSKKIDTKVSLSVKSFYLKTADLSQIYAHRPIYFADGFYYVSTDDVDDVSELLEFCQIVYQDLDLEKILI